MLIHNLSLISCKPADVFINTYRQCRSYFHPEIQTSECRNENGKEEIVKCEKQKKKYSSVKWYSIFWLQLKFAQLYARGAWNPFTICNNVQYNDDGVCLICTNQIIIIIYYLFIYWSYHSSDFEGTFFFLYCRQTLSTAAIKEFHFSVCQLNFYSLKKVATCVAHRNKQSYSSFGIDLCLLSIFYCYSYIKYASIVIKVYFVFHEKCFRTKEINWNW